MTGASDVITRVCFPRCSKVRFRIAYVRRFEAQPRKGPISRFGDTAANAGILALLQSNPYLSQLPSLIKTVFASIW